MHYKGKHIVRRSEEEEKKRNAIRRRMAVNCRLRLVHTYKEPPGWPLKRPATNYEWAHVLRLMIIRRVPKALPIHRGRLIEYVKNDLQSASDRGRIYVDSSFSCMRLVQRDIDRLLGQRTLRTAPERMDDPEMGYADWPIYRTEDTDGWLVRVPVVVRAVVDFLPTSNLLDLLLQALVDEDPS